MAKKWRVYQTAPDVVRIRVPMVVNSQWEQWVLRTSDRHHDNLHCNQDMEKRHLWQARERNAIIVDSGDLFCAMQGKWDRRSDQNQIRDEHRGNNYLDKLVSTAADFYGPYADLFAMMSPGNHETSILGHHETNLTERLVERLNSRGGQIVKGAYGGFIRWEFYTGEESDLKDSKKKGMALKVSEKYHHGYGGGGPVTRGNIQFNRIRSDWNADIYSMGHTHDCQIDYRRISELNRSGKKVDKDLMFVRIPSYKNEHATGNGWAVERGHAPKIQGAIWYRFTFDRDSGCVRYEAQVAR